MTERHRLQKFYLYQTEHESSCGQIVIQHWPINFVCFSYLSIQPLNQKEYLYQLSKLYCWTQEEKKSSSNYSSLEFLRSHSMFAFWYLCLFSPLSIPCNGNYLKNSGKPSIGCEWQEWLKKPTVIWQMLRIFDLMTSFKFEEEKYTN